MSNDEPEGGVPQRYWRFPTSEATKQVAALTALEYMPGMQDWPLEVADADRVDEFVELLVDESDSDARFVLMELVLFSLDECDPATQRTVWPTVAAILERAPLDFAHSIIYWACAREHADGHWDLNPSARESFSITPKIRAVLRNVKEAIGFSELALRH